MLALELDPDTEQRLERLAGETGQSKAALVMSAIREHLDDLEDVRVAQEVLASSGRIYTAEEAKRELGV